MKIESRPKTGKNTHFGFAKKKHFWYYKQTVTVETKDQNLCVNVDIGKSFCCLFWKKELKVNLTKSVLLVY